MSNFELFQGDTKKIVVTIKDDDGNVVNVNGLHSAKFSAVEAPSGRANYNAIPVFTKDMTNTVTYLDATNGKMQIILTPADTQPLRGNYYYEFEIIEADMTVVTVLNGMMIVKPTIIANS